MTVEPGPKPEEPMTSVCAVEDLTEGRPIALKVRGREITLIKWRDEFFALRNICPHQAAPLSAGRIAGNLVQGREFFDVEVENGNPIVRCPWHGFRFFLRDGNCVVDPNLRVRSYAVAVRDGKLYVDVR